MSIVHIRQNRGTTGDNCTYGTTGLTIPCYNCMCPFCHDLQVTCRDCFFNTGYSCAERAAGPVTVILDVHIHGQGWRFFGVFQHASCHAADYCRNNDDNDQHEHNANYRRNGTVNISFHRFFTPSPLHRSLQSGCRPCR